MKGTKEKSRDGIHTLISLADNPSRCITDTQIQHLPTLHKLVQALHHLGDTSCEVPPMHIEQVNIVCLELLQAGLD